MEPSRSATKGPGAVRTKRGFNIIKQKHQGLAFVNSSSVNEKSQTWSEFSKPLPPKMKFVAQKNVAGNKRRRSRVLPSSKDSDSDEVLSQASSGRKKSGTTRKAPSRTTRSGRLDGSGWATPELDCQTPARGSEQYPVVHDAEADESLWDLFESYNLEHGKFNLDPFSVGPPENQQASWLVPNWAMNTLPNGPSEESKLFIHAYVTMYPRHGDLETEPCQIEQSRENTGPNSAAVSSPMECATALGILFKQFKSGARDEQHISFHYGGFCSLVGRQLNGQQQSCATEAAKARCISLLAILAVSSPFPGFARTRYISALTSLSSRAY